jgi:hypothetical protein
VPGAGAAEMSGGLAGRRGTSSIAWRASRRQATIIVNVIGRVRLAGAPCGRASWMETMVLVAGLAAAGIAGIAVGFYVGVRSGGARGSGSRRAAGRAGTAGAGRPPGASPAPGSRSPSARGQAPGRQAAAGARSAAGGSGDAGARRPRSRGGWLRRGDIDAELWPGDALGSVTDEQFWDDLAADKPLATTARTVASPAPGAAQHPAAAPASAAAPAAAPPPPGGRPGAGTGTAARPAGPTGTAALPAGHPADAPGRRRPRGDDDPLTSPVYSLRGSRPGDGRSYRPPGRAGDLGVDQRQAAVLPGPPGPPGGEAYRPGGGAGTAAYRYAADAAASMSTPPYGEPYRYGDAAGRGRRGDDPPSGRRARPQDGGHRAPWYPGDGYPRPGGPATGSPR